jgi:hypothetical protein
MKTPQLPALPGFTPLGIAPRVTYEARQAILDSLEAYAKSLGLDWIIIHGTVAHAPLYKTEPAAYRLSCAGGVDVRPEQVIGETEEQARACISLAAANAKRTK